GLDPVVDGVADDVGERVAERAEDVALEADVAARGLEGDLPPERLRGVARGALERAKDRARLEEPQRRGAIARGVELGLGPVGGARDGAVEALQRRAQLLGERARLRGRGRARRRLAEAVEAPELARVLAERGDLDRGLGDR